MSNILMMGGTWNTNNGRPSKIHSNMYNAVTKDIDIINKYAVFGPNGGNYGTLTDYILNNGVPYDIILWSADIPNDLVKVNVKKAYPKAILITTKRNVDKKYSFQDIVAHGLSKKSNLIIEIQKENDHYVGRLLDPLGNQWYPKVNGFTDDFEALAIESIKRAILLSRITRQSSIQSPEAVDSIPNTLATSDFFKVVKDCAELFHKLIKPAKYITRFLGNASFRCTSGFPSMKLKDGRIYVSRRNIDKRFIEPESFVQVGLNRQVGGPDSDKSIVWYRGEHKPSVDTPIQLRLYERFPNANYMIHTHSYVKDAPFTDRMIPCGGVEEAWLITKTATRHELIKHECCAINLIGHGSIVIMNKPSNIGEFVFESRPSPEIHKYDIKN